MNTKTKKIIVGALLTLAIIIIGVFALQPKNESGNQTGSSSKELIPVDAITHGHGLAVDIVDPNKIYIATHHGLLVLINEKDLYRLGSKEDDYMGFSPHPTNPQIFFSSGHPSFGGNLGVQKSTDGGFTWEKISNGVNGPVDFHAMTVSPVNPNIMYGWYMGSLQRSIDGGKNWEVVTRSLPNVISLTADATNEETVYAATVQGLMKSNNSGKNWESVSEELKDTAVAVLAIDPQDPQKMLTFSEKLRVAKSTDGGKTWEKSNESFGEEIVLHIAISKQNSETVYALTQSNTLYKSSDGGEVWNIVN